MSETKKFIILNEKISGDFTFEEVLKKYGKKITYWCWYFINNSPYWGIEIDDLYQEFSYRAYLLFEEYDYSKHPYNHMCFSYLLNLRIKQEWTRIRIKNGARKRMSLNTAKNLDDFFKLESINSVENIYNYNVIVDYIKKIPGTTGKIIRYRFLENTTFSEMGQKFNKKPNTIAVMLYKKRDYIKENILI